MMLLLFYLLLALLCSVPISGQNSLQGVLQFTNVQTQTAHLNFKLAGPIKAQIDSAINQGLTWKDENGYSVLLNLGGQLKFRNKKTGEVRSFSVKLGSTGLTESTQQGAKVQLSVDLVEQPSNNGSQISDFEKIKSIMKSVVKATGLTLNCNEPTNEDFVKGASSLIGSMMEFLPQNLKQMAMYLTRSIYISQTVESALTELFCVYDDSNSSITLPSIAHYVGIAIDILGHEIKQINAMLMTETSMLRIEYFQNTMLVAGMPIPGLSIQIQSGSALSKYYINPASTYERFDLTLINYELGGEFTDGFSKPANFSIPLPPIPLDQAQEFSCLMHGLHNGLSNLVSCAYFEFAINIPIRLGFVLPTSSDFSGVEQAFNQMFDNLIRSTVNFTYNGTLGAPAFTIEDSLIGNLSIIPIESLLGSNGSSIINYLMSFGGNGSYSYSIPKELIQMVSCLLDLVVGSPPMNATSFLTLQVPFTNSLNMTFPASCVSFSASSDITTSSLLTGIAQFWQNFTSISCNNDTENNQQLDKVLCAIKSQVSSWNLPNLQPVNSSNYLDALQSILTNAMMMEDNSSFILVQFYMNKTLKAPVYLLEHSTSTIDMVFELQPTAARPLNNVTTMFDYELVFRTKSELFGPWSFNFPLGSVSSDLTTIVFCSLNGLLGKVPEANDPTFQIQILRVFNLTFPASCFDYEQNFVFTNQNYTNPAEIIKAISSFNGSVNVDSLSNWYRSLPPSVTQYLNSIKLPCDSNLVKVIKSFSGLLGSFYELLPPNVQEAIQSFMNVNFQSNKMGNILGDSLVKSICDINENSHLLSSQISTIIVAVFDGISSSDSFIKAAVNGSLDASSFSKWYAGLPTSVTEYLKIPCDNNLSQVINSFGGLVGSIYELLPGDVQSKFLSLMNINLPTQYLVNTIGLSNLLGKSLVQSYCVIDENTHLISNQTSTIIITAIQGVSQSISFINTAVKGAPDTSYLFNWFSSLPPSIAQYLKIPCDSNFAEVMKSIGQLLGAILEAIPTEVQVKILSLAQMSDSIKYLDNSNKIGQIIGPAMVNSLCALNGKTHLLSNQTSNIIVGVNQGVSSSIYFMRALINEANHTAPAFSLSFFQNQQISTASSGALGVQFQFKLGKVNEAIRFTPIQRSLPNLLYQLDVEISGVAGVSTNFSTVVGNIPFIVSDICSCYIDALLNNFKPDNNCAFFSTKLEFTQQNAGQVFSGALASVNTFYNKTNLNLSISDLVGLLITEKENLTLTSTNDGLSITADMLGRTIYILTTSLPIPGQQHTNPLVYQIDIGKKIGKALCIDGQTTLVGNSLTVKLIGCSSGVFFYKIGPLLSNLTSMKFTMPLL